MYRIIKIIFFPVFLSLNACTLLKFSEQLHTLQAAGKSQTEINEYVENQSEGFNLLLEDIKKNRLKTGLGKLEVLRRYGEPVLLKEAADSVGIEYLLYYRHPVRYFASDRVYLYFDKNDILVSWEYKPSQ